ncbi:MAG: hypothetical protein APR53_09660 [Methanoculleus sp. SDB]|nr:MAG: hypothetical protein APR53_09660 [Methanoculleus sp. SDB]
MTSNRYAILIASSKFMDNRLNNLRCPPKDIEKFGELLESPKYGRFTKVVRCLNEPSHEILLKIEKLLQEAKKDGLVLIYYSGHGKRQQNTGSLHLATCNTQVDHLNSTSIPVETVKEYVKTVGHTEKVALILDCCYSGAAGQDFKSGVDDEIEKLGKDREGRGIYILTSSTENEVSKELENDEYGLYTKYIIKGIETWKAANDDGNVTLNSLHDYVKEKVWDESKQTPMKSSLLEEGDIVIASNDSIRIKSIEKKIWTSDDVQEFLVENHPFGIMKRILLTLNEAELKGNSRYYIVGDHFFYLIENGQILGSGKAPSRSEIMKIINLQKENIGNAVICEI